jgi:hypothetical protein
MARPFVAVLRRRGKTEKRRFTTLDEAVDHLEAELRAAATQAARTPRPERALGRSYDPVRQVAVRGELRGPRGLRAGIDVRGDGSAEAYTGVVRRRLVAPAEREDAWAALRRVVGLGAR